MQILIIGAAGMLGRKFADRLTTGGMLDGREVTALTLADVVRPETPTGFTGEVATIEVDLAQPGATEKLLSGRPDLIVHLAAIVSGQAEVDFDMGYRINLDGTRGLFEAVRALAGHQPYRPRVVFTSSVAVFGMPFPEQIDDDFLQAPLTSYVTQKAIGELLLNDYTRRGFLDGIGLRLPTICIRPGKPNAAASGFFSNILREPLSGREAVLPVSPDVRHWFASPRAAVDFLMHASCLDTAGLGPRRTLNLPGVSATVAESIEALRQVAGDQAVSLIRSEPDPRIASIVSNWPRAFKADRATALGFRAETSMADIIRVHIEDELSR